MVDQKEEAKKEKFIETMPTMIQTHLIMCKDWATVKDTVKSLKHIMSTKWAPHHWGGGIQCDGGITGGVPIT